MAERPGRVGPAVPLPAETPGWASWSDFDYMAIQRRREHPSHDVIVRAVKRIVEDMTSPAPVILDVGVLSTVTFEKLVDAEVDTTGYVGVDLSGPIIRAAREKHPEARWIQADLARLPFSDRSVDVVLVRHVLEHVHDLDAAISEIGRVTRRAAIVCFFLPPAASAEMRTDVYENGFIHHNTWARAALEELMRQHFDQISNEVVPDQYRANEVYILSRPTAIQPRGVIVT